MGKSLVAQRMDFISHAVGNLLGTKVPPGVEELRDLRGGVGVGYKASQQQILLYDRDGVLAHIQIMCHEASDQLPSSVSLHTHTDRGAEGGQGYLAAMFTDALVIVAADFSSYQRIDMAPAMGAATKGLVSMLCRLRMKIPPSQHSRFTGVRIEMARRFLAESEELRRKRKEKKGGQGLDAQAWDGELMKETVLELNALAEMEMASPTGLTITGITGRFASQLVGVGSPASPGGAWAWYRSANEVTRQGMLQFTIPMNALDLYLAALGDGNVEVATRRRQHRRERVRQRLAHENEAALHEARATLDGLPTPPTPPPVRTLDDFIANK